MSYLDENGVLKLWDNMKEFMSSPSFNTWMQPKLIWSGTLSNGGNIDINLNGVEFIIVRFDNAFEYGIVQVSANKTRRLSNCWVNYDNANFSMCGADIAFNSTLTKLTVSRMYYWNYTISSGTVRQGTGAYPKITEIYALGVSSNYDDLPSNNLVGKWQKVGQVQGSGTDIPIDTTDCSEVMVVCSYGSAGTVEGTSYLGSTVIPVEQLTSNLQEIYLPGAYHSSNTGRYCYGKISNTKVVSCSLRTDSTDRVKQYTTVYVR